jgi:hypothetical protein
LIIYTSLQARCLHHKIRGLVAQASNLLRNSRGALRTATSRIALLRALPPRLTPLLFKLGRGLFQLAEKFHLLLALLCFAQTPVNTAE